MGKKPGFINAIESQQRTKYVYSWDQLVSVLGEFAAAVEDGVNGAIRSAGRRIVFGAPFTWKGKITIPARCIAIIIDGAGQLIVPASSGMTMFECGIDGVTFKDIWAYGNVDGANLPDWGTMFEFTDGNYCRVERCYVTGTRLVNGTMNQGWISDCFTSNAGGAATWINLTNSEKTHIESNDIDGSSAASIILGAGCERCVVMDNTMGAGGITTSASDGSNILGGNTNPGTKTLHASDIDQDEEAVSAGWTTITKTTTESRQSDTVLANDSTLQFAMAANTTYRIRLVVWFDTVAAADFKYQIAGPGGPTRVNCRRIDAVAKGTPAFRALDAAYPGSTSLLAAVDGTGYVEAELDVVNGATNADFRFLWAQVTSTASNTSVLKGSYLEYAVVS